MITKENHDYQHFAGQSKQQKQSTSHSQQEGDSGADDQFSDWLVGKEYKVL